MKRSSMIKTFTIAAITALALSIAPTAKAQDGACSTATLKGTFADRDTGFIIAGPGMTLPFAGVNLETFDGQGGLTGYGAGSVNGNVQPPGGNFKGTYTVNPDCTGTYTIQHDQGPPIQAFFVIADGGNELYIVITKPGTVINCHARRVFPGRSI